MTRMLLSLLIWDSPALHFHPLISLTPLLCTPCPCNRAFAAFSTSGAPPDPQYPGTAVERMHTARIRAKSLSKEQLSGEWEEVRRHLLWAAGLRDLPNAPIGRGNTSHAFNDYNHCDATCMLPEMAYNQNTGEVCRGGCVS